MHRRLAAGNPAADEPALALSLNNLSLRLADAGRKNRNVPVRKPLNLTRTALDSFASRSPEVLSRIGFGTSQSGSDQAQR